MSSHRCCRLRLGAFACIAGIACSLAVLGVMVASSFAAPQLSHADDPLQPQSASAKAPFQVRSASLVQQGRVLRWSVTLDNRFSGARLARSGRSLCLLLKSARANSAGAEPAAQQLCVAPGAHGIGPPRLVLSSGAIASSGQAEAIRAQISKPSPNALVATFIPAHVHRGYRDLRWQVASDLALPACAPSTAPSAGPPSSAGLPPPDDVPSSAGLPPSDDSPSSGLPPSDDSPSSAGQPSSSGSSSTDAGGCTVLYPAKPQLARLHTPKLVGCVATGSAPVFSGPASKREIALTFDDGPSDDPPSIDFVNLLARYHVPATFFEIGDQISEYDPTGAVERRMLADGDIIGDHTWTHPQMTSLSQAQQRAQLQLTAHAIERATGFTPCLWRPPYGAANGALDSLAGSLGFLTVSWSIDPRDWSLPGTEAIERNVIEHAVSGGIVELHFGGGPREQTLAALPSIITTLRERGYKLVNLAEMLGLRMVYR